MSQRYLQESELAELLRVPEATATQWRRRYGWPHMKIGREIRYTDADVRAIESLHHVESSTPPKGLPGQTRRSAARSRR